MLAKLEISPGSLAENSGVLHSEGLCLGPLEEGAPCRRGSRSACGETETDRDSGEREG